MDRLGAALRRVPPRLPPPGLLPGVLGELPQGLLAWPPLPASGLGGAASSWVATTEAAAAAAIAAAAATWRRRRRRVKVALR